MDIKGLTAMKIAGIPAPVVILAGGGVLGLYLRSRNKAAATTGAADPASVASSSSLPTAVDPNTGAIYAIDPATGQAFQLPWSGGAGSVPLGYNLGLNNPTMPNHYPTVPSPATPAPSTLDSSAQTAPIGNVTDRQGQVLTSNPIGNTLSTQITAPPVIVGTPVPLGISPVQAVQAGYVGPQADGGQLAPIPQSPTQQPNYQGSLYMAGDHPFIYG